MEGKAHLDRMTLVSGGQTGVDRAMLDFCLDHDLSCGGWCPEGRLAEDGSIALRYPLKELHGAAYEKRTIANVRDSDATVTIFNGKLQGGTRLSVELARKESKPFLLLDMQSLNTSGATGQLFRFLERFQPRTLNFNGPRASEWSGGWDQCYNILQQLYAGL